jgi:hypothetical protein
MKRIASLLLALAVAASAFGAKQLPLVQPVGGELTLGRLESKYTEAKFLGQTRVAGTFVAQWVVGVDETFPNTKQFRLILLPDSAKGLPYFQGYPVTKIDVTNGMNALQLSAGKKVAADFASKKVMLIRAEGVYLISSYIVGVECDAPWAGATILEAQSPQVVASSKGTERFGC